MKLDNALPKNVASKHITGQLVRSGTGAGANYEAARGAESRADFIHKLGVGWKELRESRYWLRLIHRAKLIATSRIELLLRESDELCAIMSKSLSTARRNS
jgi:four helix bundle protein